jgi:hypothetical protein
MRKESFRFAAIVGLSMMLAMAAGPLAGRAAAQTQPAGAATTTQVPQPPDNNVNWPGAGYGVGALAANVLYIPAKLVYAVVGGVVGGGAYLVTGGNSQTANTVWRSSLGGDYVVTPQMLAGQQPINFSGPTDTPPANPPAAENSSSTTADGVAPITPIPPSSASASSSSAGAQPLDHGAGPTGRAASGSNVE